MMSVLAPMVWVMLTSVSTDGKEPIRRVAAYHSTNQSDPDVHHDDSNCPVGRQIPDRNKRSGTNGWPRCQRCV